MKVLYIGHHASRDEGHATKAAGVEGFVCQSDASVIVP